MTYFRLSVPRKVRIVILVNFLILQFSLHSVYAQSNSDYLKSLESEASNLNLDSETKSSEKKIKLFSGDLQGKQGGAITELLPGLTIEQFEIVLKNNYIGSYLFYKRLNESQQEEVYQFYKNNPDPQKVREKILQVNKK